MSLQVTNLVGFGSGGKKPVVLEYLGTADDTANLSSYSFTSFPLGVATADRDIYVFCFADRTATATITGLTIGGVAATQLALVEGVGTVGCLVLYKLRVTTGTTATIAVSLAAAVRSCSIAVFAVKNSVNASPDDVQTNNVNGTASTAVTLASVSGGAIIAAMAGVTATGTVTWTNATEVLDAIYENAGLSAAMVAPAPGGSVTVTALSSAAPARQMMIGAVIS